MKTLRGNVLSQHSLPDHLRQQVFRAACGLTQQLRSPAAASPLPLRGILSAPNSLLGIWLGLKLTRTRETVVVREVAHPLKG